MSTAQVAQKDLRAFCKEYIRFFQDIAVQELFDPFSAKKGSFLRNKIKSIGLPADVIISLADILFEFVGSERQSPNGSKNNFQSFKFSPQTTTETQDQVLTESIDFIEKLKLAGLVARTLSFTSLSTHSRHAMELHLGANFVQSLIKTVECVGADIIEIIQCLLPNKHGVDQGSCDLHLYTSLLSYQKLYLSLIQFVSYSFDYVQILSLSLQCCCGLLPPLPSGSLAHEVIDNLSRHHDISITAVEPYTFSEMEKLFESKRKSPYNSGSTSSDQSIGTLDVESKAEYEINSSNKWAHMFIVHDVERVLLTSFRLLSHEIKKISSIMMTSISSSQSKQQHLPRELLPTLGVACQFICNELLFASLVVLNFDPSILSRKFLDQNADGVLNDSIAALSQFCYDRADPNSNMVRSLLFQRVLISLKISEVIVCTKDVGDRQLHSPHSLNQSMTQQNVSFVLSFESLNIFFSWLDRNFSSSSNVKADPLVNSMTISLRSSFMESSCDYLSCPWPAFLYSTRRDLDTPSTYKGNESDSSESCGRVEGCTDARTDRQLFTSPGYKLHSYHELNPDLASSIAGAKLQSETTASAPLKLGNVTDSQVKKDVRSESEYVWNILFRFFEGTFHNQSTSLHNFESQVNCTFAVLLPSILQYFTRTETVDSEQPDVILSIPPTVQICFVRLLRKLGQVDGDATRRNCNLYWVYKLLMSEYFLMGGLSTFDDMNDTVGAFTVTDACTSLSWTQFLSNSMSKANIAEAEFLRRLKSIHDWFTLHDGILDFLMDVLLISPAKDVDIMLSTLFNTSSMSSGASDVIHLRIIRWLLCFVRERNSLFTDAEQSQVLLQILECVFAQSELYLCSDAVDQCRTHFLDSQTCSQRSHQRYPLDLHLKDSDKSESASSSFAPSSTPDSTRVCRPFLSMITASFFELVSYILIRSPNRWQEFLASGKEAATLSALTSDTLSQLSLNRGSFSSANSKASTLSYSNHGKEDGGISPPLAPPLKNTMVSSSAVSISSISESVRSFNFSAGNSNNSVDSRKLGVISSTHVATLAVMLADTRCRPGALRILLDTVVQAADAIGSKEGNRTSEYFADFKLRSRDIIFTIFNTFLSFFKPDRQSLSSGSLDVLSSVLVALINVFRSKDSSERRLEVLQTAACEVGSIQVMLDFLTGPLAKAIPDRIQSDISSPACVLRLGLTFLTTLMDSNKRSKAEVLFCKIA